MIERAIENWLTNTNERNYLIAFCHVLMQKDMKILYVSRHGSHEQGKDTIAVNPNGDFLAYQLKTGDIDLNKWRSIKGEIEELIYVPICHPNYDAKKIHQSFLVFNGEMTDPVRTEIVQINNFYKKKKVGYSELKLIDKNMLLNDFCVAQNDFLPIELKDYNSFFELLIANGKDFLDKEKYTNYISKTIFQEINIVRSTIFNKISSSVIITSHLLKQYQENNNYFALIEAWTILYLYIVRYLLMNKFNLEQADTTLDLILREIENNAELLKTESKERSDFLEGSTIGDGGLIYKARSTIVLGALSTLELVYYHKGKDNYHFDKDTFELINKYQNYLVFWGESAFPFFYSIIKFLEIGGHKELSKYMLLKLFRTVLLFNSINSRSGLPNTYYHVKDLVENLYLNNKDIDFTEFVGSSYVLESIIEMLVRREQRSILEQYWKDCSYMQLKKFIPSKVEDNLIWRTKEGKNITEFLNPTQKWSELQNKLNELSTIPDLFNKILQILPFFIMVYPHRISNDIIRLLDISLT